MGRQWLILSFTVGRMLLVSLARHLFDFGFIYVNLFICIYIHIFCNVYNIVQ